MKMTIAGVEVNFGERGRMKWVPISQGLQVFLKNGVTLKFDPKELSSETLELAMRHGLKQKLADGCSANDTADQDEATILKQWEALKGGWSTRVAVDKDETLAKAIAEVTGKPLEEVKEKLKGMKPEEKKAIRANKRIAEVIDRLESEGVEAVDDEDLDNLF